MRKIEMLGTSFTAREENDVHRACPGTQSLFIKGLHLAGTTSPLPRICFKGKTIRPSRRGTMPKRPIRDKQTVRPGAPPRTVRDLISARLPALAQRALSTPETSEWHVTVMKALGPELANKVNG